MTRLKRGLALLASGTFALSAMQSGCAVEAPARTIEAPTAAAVAPPPPPGTTQATPRAADDLDQVVAPIALYPDALVAQILAAATYPTEVVEAQRWMQQHTGLTGDALAHAVDPQSWDPSVKALTQFPSVLAMMDKNLSWTSSLGDAYSNRPQDVLDAVQLMRERAQQAGNLKSTPQETVSTQGQTIVIEPADPEVVYVPEYDPWFVYGAPLAFYPDWIAGPGVYLGGPVVSFGLGIGIGAFAGFGWGWHHWGADWHGRTVIYNHNTYISHSRTFVNHGHGPGGSHGPSGFSGLHSSARGFNHGGGVHGGVARGFSNRGRASFGGGIHGGGFHGGHR
jgi:hypothetical protein